MVQKCANLVELEKCCQTHIFLQNFVLIQPRTSPPKICKILQMFAIFFNFANPKRCAFQAELTARWEAERGLLERVRDLKAQIYVYSNSKLERIFSNFYFFWFLFNFSKIIFWKIQQYSLGNPRNFENLGYVDLLRENCWNWNSGKN